jgi:acyl dehydratase
LGQESSTTVSFNRKDLILYAIGIGCTELDFVYELSPKFAAFPTYPLVLGFKGTSNDVLSFPSPAMLKTMNTPPLPGTKVGLDGERYLEVLNPLPLEGEFTLKNTLLGIHKRGQGALVETETTISDGKTTYVRMVSGAFLVGAKNFTPESAGKTNSENIKLPDRNPDTVENVQTSPNQTHVYRLSGDFNPLHIDPRFAKLNGFKEPILHGLCSLGIAARAVLKVYANNDPSQFKAIKVRFAKPVIPGETLAVSMWKEGNKVLVEIKAKERDLVVLNNAYVELKEGAKL